VLRGGGIDTSLEARGKRDCQEKLEITVTFFGASANQFSPSRRTIIKKLEIPTRAIVDGTTSDFKVNTSDCSDGEVQY
jgi:hypothetical protein